MRIVSGKVVGGKIEIEGESLNEGSTVTVLAEDEGETFTLGAKDEAELARRLREVESGRSVDGDELLAELSQG